MTQPPPTSPKSPSADPYDPRVVLAAERTLLAWIRTGVALMGFGFVVSRFGFFLREIAAMHTTDTVPQPGFSQAVGILLILVGVIVTAAAGLRHARFIQRYNRGELLKPAPLSLGTLLAATLALFGIIMAAYLIFVH